MSQMVPYRLSPTRVEEPQSVDGQQPPFDLNAEAAVLSMVMLDTAKGGGIARVKDLLKAEHFYSEAHRRIYEACLVVHETGKPTDIVAVMSELKTTKRLAQVGGPGYLTELLNAAPVGANLRTHAELVFDLWRLRQLLLVCDKLRAEVYLGTSAAETQGFLEKSARALTKLVSMSPRATGRPLLDVLKQIAGEITTAFKDAGKDRPAGISTTFPTIDEVTGGLLPGRKFTVVGLPGKGKSVVGLQVAKAAARQGIGVAFFATEQTAEEYGVRLMASESGVDSRRITRARTNANGVSVAEWSRVCETLTPDLAKMPLVIESSHSLTVDDVVTRARTLAESMPVTHKVPLGLVVVDYVQRLAPPKALDGQQRNHQIDYATETLKTLAQSLGVAVLELAQQTSKSDKGGKPMKPEPGMVYYSRKVEQESDVVLYLWERGQDDHVVLITKSRDGETGEVEVDFEKPFSRMRERGTWAGRDYR